MTRLTWPVIVLGTGMFWAGIIAASQAGVWAAVAWVLGSLAAVALMMMTLVTIAHRHAIDRFEAERVARSRARHPIARGPRTDGVWGCGICQRIETGADDPRAELDAHIRLAHQVRPIGPEDRPDWADQSNH